MSDQRKLSAALFTGTHKAIKAVQDVGRMCVMFPTAGHEVIADLHRAVDKTKDHPRASHPQLRANVALMLAIADFLQAAIDFVEADDQPTNPETTPNV